MPCRSSHASPICLSAGNEEKIDLRYKNQQLISACKNNKETLEYAYGGDIMARQVFSNGSLLWSCQWRGIAPLRFVNVKKDITYTWIYNKDSDVLPIRLHIRGAIVKKLGIASGKWGEDCERFLVAFDQVGTFRALINSDGHIVKRMDYDSFGNVLYDSLPQLFVPLGFAGGITDPFTGFVKFGYRYYDPTVGRFISKDPAKDTRGDGDLYDYCVDDPIGRVDRDGRFFFPLLAGMGAAVAGGLGVSWGVGKAVDTLNDTLGNKRPSAAKAVEKVAPYVAGTAATSVALTTPMPTASTVVPFMIRNQKYLDGASDFVQGYFLEGPPPTSGAGYAGTLTSNIIK